MFEKFNRIEDPSGRKFLHCASCKRSTIHMLEAQCQGEWHDHHNDEAGGSKYSTYRCGGCDAVCYETSQWTSYDFATDFDGTTYNRETTIQYPAPLSEHFSFNTESTPDKLDSILNEMLYSFAGSRMILATIGLRLAVEFIVKDKKCSGSSLDKKIDDLRNKNIIDDDQKDLLHRIRKKGNQGAHQAVGMSASELIAGMSIVEGLLENLYNGPARHQKTIKNAKQMLKP